MPIELQLIRASEFICLDADKHVNFTASKKALQALAQACWKRGLDHAMLDLRGLPVLPKPHFTAAQLAALVGTFRKAGFSLQQRLAILYGHDIHGGIRNFTFFSKMRGLQVRGFLEFEKAIYWLSAENPAEPQHGVPVPIVKRKINKRPGDSIKGIPHIHKH